MLHPDMLAAIARDRLAHEYQLAEEDRRLAPVRRARQAERSSRALGRAGRPRRERRRAPRP